MIMRALSVACIVCLAMVIMPGCSSSAETLTLDEALEGSIYTAGLAGPFRVVVELLYQSIGYRWADNLPAGAGPEVETFRRYYEAVPNVPVVVAAAEAEL